MIDKAMYREIQAFRRQGWTRAAIVKALELDPKTVAKYFGMEEESWRAYRREHLFRDKEFDRYRGEILEVYEANGFRKLPMASVYDYLDERYGALPANEQSLRNYIGYLIRTEALKLEEPGRPFRTLDVIRLLLDAFDYFGGRPEELVIDQDRLMIVSENAGDIVCTKDFQQLVDEQEVRLWVCRKADPESKGKIENLVKFTKGNFLATRNFERFQRYARDQSLEAKKFFASREIVIEVLEKALAYCLENVTVSYTNLKDTYRHFEREGRRPEPVTVVGGDAIGAHRPVSISERQLADYEQAARERAVS